MKRKSIYPFLVVLVAVAFYLYENKDSYTSNEQIDTKSNDITITDTQPKKLTNIHFLPASTTGQIVHHEGYSLSYNEAYEQAEWVAYELKKNQLSRNDFERPYFYVDKKVKTKSAHWRNYKKSGYDRGHLCPAGDRRYSLDAYNETFLTSNISPQKHDFNAGIWNTLEQKVRYWAKKYDGVYVITGGILEKGLPSIGEEKVAIPKFFYKILLDNDNGEIKMIAFLIPHKDSDRPLYEFVVSVDEIEQKTGIDFFPKLDDAIETKLEAKDDYKKWSFR